MRFNVTHHPAFHAGRAHLDLYDVASEWVGERSGVAVAALAGDQAAIFSSRIAFGSRSPPPTRLVA